MSRIVYDAPQPGEPRTAASVNDMFTAIESASSAVDHTNHAEEGYDRLAIKGSLTTKHLVGKLEKILVQTTRNALANTGAFIPIVLGGTTFQTTGAIDTIRSDEALRVRLRLQFNTTLAGGVGLSNLAGDSARFQCRLRYSVLGVPVIIPFSQTVMACHRSLVDNSPSFYTDGWIFGATAFPVDWVNAEYVLTGTPGAPAANVGRCLLTATRYYKVNQV